MRLNGINYCRAELERRIGNLAQLGGTRSYELTEGSSRGVRAIDFCTGGGLGFTVLPDRAMDISRASYKGINLVYLTPNGEVHPSFYSPARDEWLRNFFGGLLTTCGLTHFGPACDDAGEPLGLHGRVANVPARKVCDLSGWDGDDYLLRVTGIVEECSLFGDKLRLTRTISAKLGENRLEIDDLVENFGYHESPFTILYHVNPGFPLLDAGSELFVSAGKPVAYAGESQPQINAARRFTAPQKKFEEQNFYYKMIGDASGNGTAALINHELSLGLYLEFPVDALPWLSEWKMMAEGDYVVGLEPCNTLLDSRPKLRAGNLLPTLAPGEQRHLSLTIGVLEGKDVASFVEKSMNLNP